MPPARRNARSVSAPASTSSCCAFVLLALLLGGPPAYGSTWGTPVCVVGGDQAPVVLVPATLPGAVPQVGAFALWEDQRYTPSSPSHLYWKWLGPDLGAGAPDPADGLPFVNRPNSQSGVAAVRVAPGGCASPFGCTSLVAAYREQGPAPDDLTLRITRMDDLATAWDVELDGHANPEAHGLVAAGDDAGDGEGVIVAWIAPGPGGWSRLRAQRVSAGGALLWGPEGEWVVPDGALGQVEAAVAPVSGGGAYVAWQDNRMSPNYALIVTRLGLDGAPAPGWPVGGLALRVDGHGLFNCRLVPDAADGVFAIWREFRHTPGGSLVCQSRVQHVLGDGSLAAGWPVEGAWLFERPDEDFTVYPVEAQADRLGGLVAVDHRTSGGLLVQRLGPDGSFPAGWPAEGTEVSSIPGLPYGRSLSVDADGTVTVVWSDHSEGFDSMYLLGARFRPDGSRPEGWPEIGITVARTGGTDRAITVPGGGGSVLAVWPDRRNAATSGTDLFAQIVPATGRSTAGAGGPATVQSLDLSFANAQPAHGSARFRLALPAAGQVSAEVFDLSGRRLGVLAEGEYPEGVHELQWSGAGAPSAGIRFLRVRTASGERALRFVELP